jgi:hypothetical protein
MSFQTLPTTAAEIREHLLVLRLERTLADVEGRATDAHYMADLDGEIDAAVHAFVGTAVTEIASLRGELAGVLRG